MTSIGIISWQGGAIFEKLNLMNVVVANRIRLNLQCVSIGEF